MKSIRIKYLNFWMTDQKDFIISQLLSKHYNVHIVDKEDTENIDLLISSWGSDEHLKYNNCIKLHFSGENTIPNFNECDYGIGSAFLSFGDRYIRCPFYAMSPDNDHLANYEKSIMAGKYFKEPTDSLFDRDFCSLVVSNSTARHPILFEFEEKLSKYKPIAYGGKYKNNVGGCIEDKMSFIANYKFNIAFENSSVEGYTTEKIIEPIFARTIPIYWGDKLVSRDINPNSFINLNDFDTVDKCIEYIIKVDNDPKLYLEYFKHTHLTYEKSKLDELEAFLLNIMTTRKRYLQPYGNQFYYNKDREIQASLYENKRVRSFDRFLKKLEKRNLIKKASNRR